MTVKYIDTHCHLQFGQYASDREEIIEKMLANNIAGIVVGTDFETSKQAVELAGRYEHIFASVGMHPNHNEQIFSSELFYELAARPEVVAIGECGLDYFRTKKEGVQKKLFQEQIKLAAITNKPLIIHSRSDKNVDAYEDTIQILKEQKEKYPNLCGVIHFFTGDLFQAKEFINLGFVISFTAVITFSRNYDKTIRSIPLKSVLLETDAPYVAPDTRRGKRNDPFSIVEIVSKISEIRGEELEFVRSALLENASDLFRLRMT